MNRLRELIGKARYKKNDRSYSEVDQYLRLHNEHIADLIDAAKQVSDNLQEYTDQTDALLLPKAAAKLKSALAKLEAK